jgi:hypothetical protein
VRDCDFNRAAGTNVRSPTRLSSGGHGFSNMRAIRTGPIRICRNPSSHIEDRNPFRSNLAAAGLVD